MARQLTQAWKTPDGRYFDSKDEAKIFMNVEDTKDKLAEVHPALAPVVSLLCQNAYDIIRILTEYQESNQPTTLVEKADGQDV